MTTLVCTIFVVLFLVVVSLWLLWEFRWCLRAQNHRRLHDHTQRMSQSLDQYQQDGDADSFRERTKQLMNEDPTFRGLI